jgi:hypothetical protein
MSKRDIAQEASLGSLDAGPLNDLIVLSQFELNRDKLFAKLFGTRLRRSRLREELLRTILVEFGLKRVRPINFYKRTLSDLGSATAIRMEIDLLACLKLLVVKNHPTNARQSQVVPTVKMIAFYNSEMPRIAPELQKFMVSWG